MHHYGTDYILEIIAKILVAVGVILCTAIILFQSEKRTVAIVGLCTGIPIGSPMFIQFVLIGS